VLVSGFPQQKGKRIRRKTRRIINLYSFNITCAGAARDIDTVTTAEIMLIPQALPTNQQLLTLGVAASVLYILALLTYRLYFSPIAKFPGPKLAALTFWYEFYYDVIKRGRYTWKIGELHQKYGSCLQPT
jgi:hypothetical protein